MIMVDRVRRLPVKGDYIAMVPTRDHLLLTGSEDEEGLKGMVEIAAQCYGERGHPMTLHAFRLSGEDWVPWLPESDDETSRRLREMALQSLGTDYKDQKELLEKLHERDGIDEFVASFSGVQHKDTGRLLSYCVWSQGVRSLLPRTDWVMFFAPDEQATGDGRMLGHADWDRVVEVAGGLMTGVDELYPARYRVTEFPTPDQLRSIGVELP
jgi:hypothetical protein